MKIELPEKWSYQTEIQVRVTDLNYGNHLANQNILTFAHEARVRMYEHFGFTESDFGGPSLIQADAAIVFKSESFAGDILRISMALEKSGSSSFQVYYLFSCGERVVAEVRTAMVCFDYTLRKVVQIPEVVLQSAMFN